ncbi:MAG: M28 family peptidase [Actinophytocola sp.]|nr:M28 family peptidase [Actinophytocola sp.]
MPAIRRKLAVATAVAASAALVLTTGSAAVAESKTDDKLAKDLVGAVSAEKVNKHLIAFQRFADQTGGNRAASTDGHAKSAEYIATKLEGAGYDVTRQEFPFVYDETTAESLTSGGQDYDVIRMSYSPSTPAGGITAPLAAVPVDETPGCEASDYDGVDVAGKIALISRGACTFADKQKFAGEAGAVAALIYNHIDGPVNGTLGDPDVGIIPSGGMTNEDGQALVARAGEDATVEITGITEDRTTYNVIAETKRGARDNVVMAGAHLDSVAAGPGINDNGTGSGALLETALALGGKPKANNAVRFAWWSAEELGLLGSEYYVENLSADEQLDIAMYLNFDMIGSPNAGYFVYDGDDSDGIGAGPGPEGSGAIESELADFIEGNGTETEGTDFTGRSDYGPFIAVGIPSGGLFTGAEVSKTEAQAAKWGGEAGVAYDACYHQECDTLSNVDHVSLDVNGDAMAWAIGIYAMSTESVNGVQPGHKKPKKQVAEQRSAEKVHDTHSHRNQHGHNHDHDLPK